MRASFGVRTRGGGVEEVRELARNGRLATVMSAATGSERSRLTGATYEIAWPVVFARVTHAMELRRGHPTCAISVRHLAADCLDRFEDDVEAVVGDVERRANRPIDNLEAWIANRVGKATVDGHRRRRGERGALQRPRVPRWLARALGDDPWLAELATWMLVWVGTPTTAGTEVWPLDTWAWWKGRHVSADIDRVLVAMRTRPEWYERYVETPLGHKQPPTVGPMFVCDRAPAESAALALVSSDALYERHLTRLAELAGAEILRRLRCGHEPGAAVTDVIRAVFCGDDVAHDLDRMPHTTPNHDERLAVLLCDPAESHRIVAAVLAAVAAA